MKKRLLHSLVTCAAVLAVIIVILVRTWPTENNVGNLVQPAVLIDESSVRKQQHTARTEGLPMTLEQGTLEQQQEAEWQQIKRWHESRKATEE